ncbi:MAG: polyphosphate polymerase domain-containing protein [Bacteroidales bacterium]|nr:polyphosphate polymerase domain-containing protein [Bacteroidales bacterium]
MTEVQDYTELKGFRYERKYLADSLNSFQTEQVIKIHPAGFSEIYQQRFINNVYFDTPRFDFYYDNAVGRTDRVKFRIRWYGDLFGFIEEPILELKIKQGTVGTKRSFKLKPFEFSENFKIHDFSDILKQSDLPEDVLLRVGSLKPSIINRYSRKYFRDFSQDFRITIDKDISYFPVQNQIKIGRFFHKDMQNVVIELKYDNVLNKEATKISNKLPFRLTKNSKYVTGVELFYDVLD